jgi:hypothetical protein
VLLPGGDGVGRVEPRRRGDGFPETLEVRLAEHRCRPAGARGGDDDPVEKALRNERKIEGTLVTGLGPPDESRVQIAEKLRLLVAREGDQGGTSLAPGADPLEHVGRRAPEHVVGPELDRRTANVRIGVTHDDTLRAGFVRLTNHRARRRRVPYLAENDHLLTGLDVRTDADRELGIATEALARA